MKLIDKMSSHVDDIQTALSFLNSVAYGFLACFMLVTCLALIFFTGFNWFFAVIAVLSFCYFLVCITTGGLQFRFKRIGYLLLAVITTGYLVISIINFVQQGTSWNSLIIAVVCFLIFGMGSLFTFWVEWFGYPKTRAYKIDWNAVSFDNEYVYRQGTLPTYRKFFIKVNQKAVQSNIKWSHISQVCFYSKGLYNPAEMKLVESFRNTYIIPIDTKGGNELWTEIINRGLFDKELATEVMVSAIGEYCSPEFYNKEMMTTLTFDTNSRKANYWAYGDYYCVSKSGTEIFLPYAGEPPHGDSYHKLIINNKTVERCLWCGLFVWSPTGSYFACNYDGIKTRNIIVVDVDKLKYRIVETPKYEEIHAILKHDENEFWDTLLETDVQSWLELQ